jgi:hypothetical protein
VRPRVATADPDVHYACCRASLCDTRVIMRSVVTTSSRQFVLVCLGGANHDLLSQGGRAGVWAGRGGCGRQHQHRSGQPDAGSTATRGGWKGEQAPIAGFTPFCGARSPSGAVSSSRYRQWASRTQARDAQASSNRSSTQVDSKLLPARRDPPSPYRRHSLNGRGPRTGAFAIIGSSEWPKAILAQM